MKTVCQLDYAAGQMRHCTGDTCPFWVDDHCAVARHWEDFAGNEELTKLLRGLRSELAGRDPNLTLRRVHPPGFA